MLQSCSLFHLGCVQLRGNQICWNFLIWSRFVSWPPIFVITNFYYICSLKHLLQILPRLAFTTINCSFQIFLANCCIKIGKYTCLSYFDPKYKCISWFYYKLKHLVKLSSVTHTGIILLSVSFHIHLCPLIGVCMLLVFLCWQHMYTHLWIPLYCIICIS